MIGGRDDADGLSDSEIRGALASLGRVKWEPVTRSGSGVGRIKNARKKAHKQPLLDAGVQDINKTVKIEVELPAYMVVGLMEQGDLNLSVREAVRDWLKAQGSTWWQQRFLSVIEARAMDARDRFTRMKRLG